MMNSSREKVVKLNHGSLEENPPHLAAFRPDFRMSQERCAGIQLDHQPFRNGRCTGGPDAGWSLGSGKVSRHSFQKVWTWNQLSRNTRSGCRLNGDRHTMAPGPPECSPMPCPISASSPVNPLTVAEAHRMVLVVPTVHLLKAKLVFIALHFQRLAML